MQSDGEGQVVEKGSDPSAFRGYGQQGSRLRELTYKYAVWVGEPPVNGPKGHWANPQFDYHRDDERYDEIKIFPAERYKTSDMSGDEWRFGIRVQIKWKGKILGQGSYCSMEDAIRELDHFVNFTEHWFKGCSDDPAGKIRIVDTGERIQFCFQPGCCNAPVSVYDKKFLYGKHGMKEEPETPHLMLFCKNHLRRGDCGLEDSDINYEVLDGPGPEENDWKGMNVTESI